MAYTPPEEDNVNFDLSGGYAAPEEDAVDFDFQTGLTISAPATNVSISTPNSSVSVSGSASISAPTSTVGASTPPPSVSGSGSTSVSAPETTISVSTPHPILGIGIDAPPTTASISTPTPYISGSSPVTIGAQTTDVSTSTPTPSIAGTGSISASADATTVSVINPTPDLNLVLDLAVPATVVSIDSPSATVDYERDFIDVGGGQVGVTDNLATTVGVKSWAIEGMELGEVMDVTFTHQSVKVTYRLTDTEVEWFRGWMGNAQQVNRNVDAEGDWRGVDTSLTGNVFEISPPDDVQPPLHHFRGLPKKRQERTTDREGKWHELTVDYVLESPRTTNHSDGWSDESRDTGEWLFEFQLGDVATTRVQSDVQRKTQGGEGTVTLRTVMTAEEVAVLAESANRNDAVRSIMMADGKSRSEDTSPDKGNTVTITPPSDGDRFIANASYVIMEWKVQVDNAAAYVVEIKVNREA